MEEQEKAQLVTEAASILILHATTLRSIAAITLAVSGMVNRLTQLDPELADKLCAEIQLIFDTTHLTQKNIQKTGTAQSLFIEDLKEKFGVGEGKPKNVRKGNLRKKE